MNKMVEEINQYLATSLDHLQEGKVKEAMYYSLLAPGKRIRPILMLKVLQAYNLDYHDYIDVACAIEFVHTYSLIHDDLPAMDNDDLRRGRPTCHKAFDEATAILAGDALLTEAFNLIINSKLEDTKKVKCIRILGNASGQNGMVYGQQQDMFFENKKANLEELQNIHLYKTGKLIAAPLMMGGVIADQEDLTPFKQLGLKIGLAYQIQDDILDIIGDEALIGKKVGSDLENHKSTYVALLGLEKSQETVRQYFNDALEQIYKLRINHGILIEMLQILIQRKK